MILRCYNAETVPAGAVHWNRPTGADDGRAERKIEMMNLNQAIRHGRAVGVRFYVKTASGAIFGGTKTRDQAEAMKRRFEAADRENPSTKGTTKFVIEEVQ